MALKINDTIRATRVGGRRPLSAIRAIVFHYTANTGLHATALGNARYFANGSEGRAASAHFVVDEGDTVYQCVPLDEWPEFVQPTGAHDAYKKGDKVTFEGKHYISLIDANVYSPTAYPAGWQEQA